METLYKRLAIFFLVLSFLILALRRANYFGGGTPGQFDHYILALRWPPSICKEAYAKRCNTPVPKRFTIHGLWPSNISTASPEDCDPSSKLDYKNIHGISKDLDANWPNLFEKDTSMDLWSKEWAKHGTCSGLSQLEYFQRALGLHTQVNVLQRLIALDFGPDSKKTYDPSTIISKYQQKYNVVLKITCVENSSAQEMIGEIHFQVKKDGKTVESIIGRSNMCKTTTVAFPDK